MRTRASYKEQALVKDYPWALSCNSTLKSTQHLGPKMSLLFRDIVFRKILTTGKSILPIIHQSACTFTKLHFYKTKLVLDPKILYCHLKKIFCILQILNQMFVIKNFRRKRSITKKPLRPVSRQSLVSIVFIQKILSNHSKIWSARIKFFLSFVTNSWGRPGHYLH